MEARLLTARPNSPHMVNGEWVRGCPRGRCVSGRVVMDQFARRDGGCQTTTHLYYRSVVAEHRARFLPLSLALSLSK